MWKETPFIKRLYITKRGKEWKKMSLVVQTEVAQRIGAFVLRCILFEGHLHCTAQGFK